MAQKCVHQGCGKSYDEGEDEGCLYHPGPPVFHEGQKGKLWHAANMAMGELEIGRRRERR